MGAGRGYRMVLGLTLGTGIGGGLVVDGAPWPGRHGIAGEWGHACLEPGGRPCYCGREGCAEQYLSGPALEGHYQASGGKAIGLPAIVACADTDPLAAKVLNEAAVWFGHAVGNLVNLLDPDVIVLGGGVSALPLWFGQGREAVARQAMTTPFSTPILPATLGHSSGVLGAALVGAETSAAT